MLDPQALTANEENRQQLQQITEHLEDLKLYIQQHLNAPLSIDQPQSTDTGNARDTGNVSRPFTVARKPLPGRGGVVQDANIEAALQVLDGRQKVQEQIPASVSTKVDPIIFHLNAELNLKKITIKKRRKFYSALQLVHTFSTDREDLLAAKALRLGYYVHKTDLPPFSTTEFQRDDCHPWVQVANLQIGLTEGWIYSSYAHQDWAVPCSSHYYGFLFSRIKYEDLLGVTADKLDSIRWPLKRTFELSAVPCPDGKCPCRKKRPLSSEMRWGKGH